MSDNPVADIPESTACAWPGCRCGRAWELPMCRYHWACLPRAMRRRLWSAYNPPSSKPAGWQQGMVEEMAAAVAYAAAQAGQN